MGVPSSAGQGPPRGAGRSIGSYFAARLAVPAVCLVLVWGAVAGAVFAGALHHVIHPSAHRALVEAMVVAGAGLLVVLAVIALIWAFARRLAKDAGSLAATARHLADEQLPQAVARLRGGAGVDAVIQQASWRAQPARIAEFAAVTAALASMEGTATAAAASEARLRGGFRQVLTSLGRRNQSLLLRQLRILDTLEQQAASPAALADLFALDHLTTRMRRHAESLTVLSGAPTARPRIGPVSVIDVIRAAVAETEDYKRVVVRTETAEVVAASAVNDMIHLLAELIENATMFSPSATRVEVRAERVANGFAIEVEDRGLGIAPDQLSDLNARLASPPDFDVVDADRLGLFVAGLLAARHGVEVYLTPSPYRGTKAIVLLPDELVLPGAAPDGPAGAARLRATNALSLIGAAASPRAAGTKAGRRRCRRAARDHPSTACRAASGRTSRRSKQSWTPRPATSVRRRQRTRPRQTTRGGSPRRCSEAGTEAGPMTTLPMMTLSRPASRMTGGAADGRRTTRRKRNDW